MEVSPSTDGAETLEMTFELETDELMDTRSVEGIAHIDQLCYAIWDNTHNEMAIEPVTMDNVDISSGKLSIKVIRLGDDEYTAYFWAQSSECDAYQFFDGDSKTLTINHEGSLNNDPKYDAFFGKTSFKGNEQKKKVIMTRPFALINLMTPISQGKEITQSAVTIKGIGTKWNVDTDEISNPEDVTFKLADIPEGTFNQYKLLSQCYVLAPVQATKHEMIFQLNNEENKIVLKDIPVKRNNRTNIVYNFNAEEVEYSLYYPSIQDALNGDNGTDAQQTETKVAVYEKNGVPHIVLLEDMIIGEKLAVTKDVCIELNGRTMSSTGDVVIEVSGGSLHIEGQNGSIKISNEQKSITVSAINVNEGAALTAVDCTVEADCKKGFAYGIHSFGDVTLTRCRVIGKADHTANAAGTDYGTTSKAVWAEAGSLVVNDCYAYGMHSGMTVKCDLTVNGGKYDGYSHGGIYFAGQDKTARIYNAKLNDASLLEGYISDTVAGTNHAGMYIGGATNMKVYMDNCEIYGYSQPIVMKNNAATSYLYISNSKMNKDYTHRGIRNGSSNYVYFGKGNEFGPEVLETKHNYEETTDVYDVNYKID